MKRRYKILLGTLATFILAGGIGGYIAYNKASDYVLEKVMENVMEKQLDEYLNTLDLDAILSAQGEQVTQGEADTSEEKTDEKVEDNKVVTNSAKEDKIEDTKAPTDQADTLPTSKPEKDKTPTIPSGVTNVEELKEAAKQDIQAQAQAIVNQIPNKDKNSMMGLVLGNLSSSDLSSLMSLVADGNISGSDIAKAKEVALKSFSEEQLEQVKYYYSKYVHLVLQ